MQEIEERDRQIMQVSLVGQETYGKWKFMEIYGFDNFEDITSLFDLWMMLRLKLWFFKTGEKLQHSYVF